MKMFLIRGHTRIELWVGAILTILNLYILTRAMSPGMKPTALVGLFLFLSILVAFLLGIKIINTGTKNTIYKIFTFLIIGINALFLYVGLAFLALVLMAELGSRFNF